MKLLLLCLCAAGLASAGVLQEYEGFNYPGGESLQGKNGGLGWAAPWGHLGLDATINGGAASTAGFQGSGGESVAYWFRDLGTGLGADNTTAYVSFYLRPDDGFGFYGGMNFGGVFVGLSGDQDFYGLEGADSNISLSTLAPSAGQWVWFVARLDFLPGNDQISLYLNPVAGDPEPAVPDVFKTDIDAGQFATILLNNYGGYTTDEIRIGTGYDAVTASVPEPAFTWGLGVLLAGAMLLKRTRSARSTTSL